MALDRPSLVAVGRILRPTKCYHHLVSVIQEMIHKGPRLNLEERNLVQFAYKGLINERRTSIRVITEEMNSELRTGDTVIRSKLLPIKAKLLREMRNYCSELSALIDTKLVPNAEDVRAMTFFLKLKADAFRYLAECPDIPDRQDFILKATESYNAAMMNAQDIPKRSPLALGLVLN
jgi:14-3-3 protein epsilon